MLSGSMANAAASADARRDSSFMIFSGRSPES
jgi:hypothetical protein